MSRRQDETPEGLRERVDDITAEAQHWLDRIVALQPGIRLSAVFDLLKANETLMDLYTHNWAHEYAARCDALRAGDLVPDPRDDADPTAPAVESLVLSLSQELRLPNDPQPATSIWWRTPPVRQAALWRSRTPPVIGISAADPHPLRRTRIYRAPTIRQEARSTTPSASILIAVSTCRSASAPASCRSPSTENVVRTD